MCVGNLFGGPKAPAPPPRMRPAPPLKPTPAPTEMPTPDKIKDEEGDEKLSTRRKKALEIKKVQAGVKEFGAINPAATPETPEGGITTPGPSV